MLRQVNLISAVKAGIFGTLVMTVIMYGLPPLMGAPPMDIMAALGAVFPFNVSPYVPGAIVHFANGIILAGIYAVFFYFWLPGPNWLRGMLFSLLPWLFAITLLGSSLQLASRIFGTAAAGAANPCAASNPCAPTKNPCATANPCAANAANPCAAKNPHEAKTPTANPCVAKPANPCAAAAANPCASGVPSEGGIPPQALSLVVHLIYGGVLGAFYRPRA